MRLVDADKLLEPGYTNMFDEPIRFDMVSRYAIESAPTVKAIPIEWIKKHYGWLTMAGKMIEDWVKENEKSSNSD